ncbi:bifunctional protein FolD 4, chloroplastic isoform X2 [Coffea eugenioides]|uniref:bifunctional protein FolD 4, chloroplastic isoform X2 n=1 Tax=Coffea eugenioides TaxID=49369 RepID=UPI000F5D31D6|nr:bifunctional protein FolD 4, chloroplastic-like isoform X2 [Coffea arabica]XP_027162292.1 bifunctional protein FolD 4, chloroplastic isoform X2 [Coffea eugenioides]
MASPSSMTTTSSTTSKLVFSGCSTSSSSSSSPRLLPLTTATTSSKCRAFHFHRRFNPLRHVHLRPCKNPTTVFAQTISPPSFIAAAMATEPSAKVIDGKRVAKEIREEVAAGVSKMKEALGVVPGLAVILVGDRKDSATYVRNKKKACEDAGIKSFEACLPKDATEEEVLKHISSFNNDPAVHGILVQLPLPSHINEQNVLNAVCIEKDVDGFHPLNIGRLAMRDREPLFVPCTPKGCIELLHRYGVVIKGKRAVVIGRSNIVGMPAALLLQDSESPRGYRLVGDVCYDEARQIASAITPVPGGVGPMTIAMLLSNTLTSAKRIHNFN